MKKEIEITEAGPVTVINGQDHKKFVRMYTRYLNQPNKQRKKLSSIKLSCGFSATYSTKIILQSPKCKLAMKSVQEARQELQQTLGTTIYDTTDIAKEIRDNPENAPSDRLRASKQVIDVVGHNAPVEVQVTSRALIVELKDLSIEELKTLDKGILNND